jgi:hypothetical protein
MIARRSVGDILWRSLDLLRRNPSIVVPGLIVGVAAGVVTDFIQARRGSDDDAPFSNVPASIAAAVSVDAIAIAAAVLSIAYTTGMASAAWERGKATFRDGRVALAHGAGHIVVAMVGLTALGVVAAILAPYTALISFVIYGFFCVYTMPAAVVGGLRGLAAIAESVRIAYRRALPTMLMVIAIVAIAVVLGIAGALLSTAPFVGDVLSAVLLQVLVAYVTLVVVGEYLALRAAPAGAAGTPTPAE